MAISIVNLTAGNAATAGSSQSTASVSPSASKLLLLTVSSRTNATVEPNQPTVTGNGLTWVAVNVAYWDTTSASRKKQTTFRAMGSPTSGVITIDFGGQTQTNVVWVLDEVTGMDTSGSNGSGAIVQSVAAVQETLATTHSVTLAAFASSTNSCYATFAQDAPAQTTFTPKSGFTSLGQSGLSQISVQSEYLATQDTTPSYTYGVNALHGGIAIEIKEASSSPQTITAPLFTNTNTFYSATISQGGAQTLTASRLENSNTFYAHTVALGITANHVLSGAVTETTARVIARLSGETTDARLEYATNSGFTGSTLTTAVNVTTGNDLVAAFALTGLTANTQYYYRTVINGSANALVGKFKTVVFGQHNFTFAFSGDADIVDTQNVYDRIVTRNPDFFFALGDTPYIDSGAASVTPYQNGYKDWFGDSNVKAMLAAFPYQYIWDDHDYGLNDSDSTNAGKASVQSVYRQHIPHYPLEVGDSIYHAFTVGRVRFLVTDLRSERLGTTFMSTAQMNWFKGEITAASTNNNIGLVVWANSIPYISSTGTDTWFGATAQRAEIANHIASVNMQNNICIISADAHMIAADNGTNSDYSTGVVGGYPVFQSAPLNRENSTKGGPYSEGTFASSNGQYSIMSVVDNGVDISVNVKGYNSADTQLYTFDFIAEAKTQALAAPLYTNTNTFYSASISQTGATQTLTATRLDNSNTFYAHTMVRGAVSLVASRFDNTNTFYTHNISVNGAPQTLVASRFDNGNTFYAHSLALGAVGLTANRLDNSSTFYSHSISQGGAVQTLTATRLDSSNAFYSHNVSVGSVQLVAALLTNTNAFYSHIINLAGAQTLVADRHDNTSTFYGFNLNQVGGAQSLVFDLFTNVSEFYPARIPMALIVEDGTALTNSQSYISVSDANTYHSNRGNLTWLDLTVTEAEEALRRATDYMQQTYAGLWKGYRKTVDQALDFPRTQMVIDDVTSGSYYSDTTVPIQVKYACAELAYRAAHGELSTDETQKVVKEKIDVLEVQYSEYGSQSTRFVAVDNYLSRFLVNTKGGVMRKLYRV